MNKTTDIFSCKAEQHHIKIQVKEGLIVKCGYVRRCGSWHYALFRPQKFSSKSSLFETNEPKAYKNTLSYCLSVLYTYDKPAFERLVKLTSKNPNLNCYKLVSLIK